MDLTEVEVGSKVLASINNGRTFYLVTVLQTSDSEVKVQWIDSNRSCVYERYLHMKFPCLK
jgi:hypothetical protein